MATTLPSLVTIKQIVQNNDDKQLDFVTVKSIWVISFLQLTTIVSLVTIEQRGHITLSRQPSSLTLTFDYLYMI